MTYDKKVELYTKGFNDFIGGGVLNDEGGMEFWCNSTSEMQRVWGLGYEDAKAGQPNRYDDEQ